MCVYSFVDVGRRARQPIVPFVTGCNKTCVCVHFALVAAHIREQFAIMQLAIIPTTGWLAGCIRMVCTHMHSASDCHHNHVQRCSRYG